MVSAERPALSSSSRRAPWRVVALAGAVAGGAALAVARSGGAGSPAVALGRFGALSDDTPSLSGLLRVYSSNIEYGRSNLTQYPFLYERDAVVAEPHRLTTFMAEGDAAAVAYDWYLDETLVAPGDAVLTTVFTATGSHLVRVVADAGYLDVEVYVKYVRRELRKLSAEDRRKWTHAASTLWKLSTREGRAVFGENYVDIHHLAIIHNDLAGNRYCDFIHGSTGYAFVNAHAALGAMLEQAMQAVEPTVSLPYWDYTYDKWLYTDRRHGDVRTSTSKDLLSLWESPMWSHEFFGASDAETGELVDGAWLGYRVPVLSEPLYARAGLAGHFYNHSFSSCYGQDVEVCSTAAMSALRDDGDSQRHMGNSFGLLRSPWNMRAAPTITRSRRMCGSANNAQFPDCTSYIIQQADYATFEDYVVNLQVSPHGTVHVWSGGAFGTCSETYDALAEVVNSTSFLAQIKSKSSDLQKNLWMDNIKTCPARGDCLGFKQEDCVCSCTTYLSDLETDDATLTNITDSLVWTMFLQIAFDGFTHEDKAKAHMNDLDADAKLAVLQTVCDNDVLTGDMLGSNSPLDISFFATHAEVERLWQRYALSGNMTNATWPQPDGGSLCPGQHPDYKLVWFRYQLEDKSDTAHLTNVKWRDLLNPANPSYPTHIPYLFDNFDWDHCYKHYTNADSTIDASLMRPEDWVWFKDPAHAAP